MGEKSGNAGENGNGYSKDFDHWNEVKKQLDGGGKMLFVKPGEVYWTSVGVNVGSEINGKNVNLTRPVLVIKRNDQRTFVGVPFTTKMHDGQRGFMKIIFDRRIDYVALNQIRTFSTKRLIARAGKISPELLICIREQLRGYLDL